MFLKDLCGYNVESGLGRIQCGLGRPDSGVLPFVQVRNMLEWMEVVWMETSSGSKVVALPKQGREG